MKCTESEDEEPTKGTESQLQLSCFINQEVKYLATGLRLVSGTSHTSSWEYHQCSQSLLIFTFSSLHLEATGGHHKAVPILTKKCPLYQIGMLYLLTSGIFGEMLFCSSVSSFVQQWNEQTLMFLHLSPKSAVSRHTSRFRWFGSFTKKKSQWMPKSLR